MEHVKLCMICGDHEVGTFQVHNDFCSDGCADEAHEFMLDAAGEFMYDDDYADQWEPNDYSGEDY